MPTIAAAIPSGISPILPAATGFFAAVCAAVFGWCAWHSYSAFSRRIRLKENIIRTTEGDLSNIEGFALRLAAKESMRTTLDSGKRHGGKGLKPRDSKSGTASLSALLHRSSALKKKLPYSGLEGFVTESGFCAARLKLSGSLSVIGGIAGLCISPPLMCLLGAGGCVFGWTMPQRELDKRVAWRSKQMERHLPEMLDVIAIGMRSGLSFDRSLSVYCSRFDSLLARELELAQCQWQSGLAVRDEALRKISDSYDSAVFGRVVESVIRSLRFGSSVVEGLESASAEARMNYRTRRQEQVAKAPVKMMIPTGTLILPAMLIMVLGPVLLEMASGGW